MNFANKHPGVIRTPENHCLNCGKLITAVGPGDDSGYQAGPNDITQCIRCGAVMALDDELRLRPLTDQEIEDITGDRELMDEIAAKTKAIRFIQATAIAGVVRVIRFFQAQKG